MSDALGSEQAYLNFTRCMKLLDGVARHHGGAVDKYQGDRFLAVFGYPIPLVGASTAAVEAAAQMRQCVAEYNRDVALDPPIGIRIGINTGDMVAGTDDSLVREFDVLGDDINVAARLKASAPVGSVYVGPATYAETRERHAYRQLGQLQLKGKQASINAYQLLSSGEAFGGDDSASSGHVYTEHVGRGAELEELGNWLARTTTGMGGAVAVVGEEGAGKSRLLREFGRGREWTSALLEARGRAFDRESALAPWVALVRRWADVRSGDDADRVHEKLETAADRLGRDKDVAVVRETVLALATEANDERERAKQAPGAQQSDEKVVDAISRLIVASAVHGAVLLVLDDVQWFDAASLDLLERILPLSHQRRILFLLSLRPEPADVAERVTAAVTECNGRVLRLQPLSAEASRRIVDSLVGAELPEANRALVVQRADGNPARLIQAAFLASALRSDDERAGAEERSSDTERRRATLLFADISGFTAMTERLGTERAFPIVSDCRELLASIARKHGGTVDKYVGDCVITLFGVPEAIEDAPRAAVNAAIEMRRRVREANEQRALDVALDVHIGIDTGLGISGDISGPLLREFAVMGDAVEVADRLKDLAPAGRIYVGRETYLFTHDVFEYRGTEPLTLEGRREPVPVYDLLSDHEQLHRTRVGSVGRIFSPMVGREHELEVLRGCLERLQQGRGGIVSVVAEAGLGKSRLLMEVAATQEARAVAWHEARSIAAGQRLSFHPFADLCRSLASIEEQDDDETARGKLERLVDGLLPGETDDVVPFISTVLGLASDPAQEARLSKIQGDALEKLILRSMNQVLRAASTARPMVIVMDDLHWADLSSVALLESLLRLVDDEPLLFVNLCRPGFEKTSDHVREVARTKYANLYREITLEPLNNQGVRALLNNLFRRGSIPHLTRNLIEEKAQGNPFYIEEVVRRLVDERAVERRDGSFVATERIHEVEIPGTIQEVIMARVDSLSLAKRQVLQTASVIGGSFHLAVLGDVMGEDGPLADSIGELAEAEFVVPSERQPELEYDFKHPLIQEVTYAGLLTTKREELHRRVAEAILARLPEDTPGYHGMLAYHFSMGRDLERAEEWLFRAGDEAASAAASSEALHFFQDASTLYLRLHADGGDPRKKAVLEKNIAHALYYRGRFIEAIDHFDRALELLGDRLLHGRVQSSISLVRHLATVLGRLYVPAWQRKRPEASQALREIMDLRYARAEATATASPTRHLFDSMDTLALLERVDPTTVPGSGRMYAGAAGLFAYGGISFGVSERLAALARGLVNEGDLAEYFYERAMSFTYHVLKGDWGTEHEIAQDHLDECLRNGQLWGPTTYLGFLGEKRIHQGDFESANACLERIDEIWNLFSYDLAKTNHYYLSTLMPLELNAAASAVDAANAYYDENPEDLLHILALGSRAKGELLLGRLDAAVRTLEEAAELMARCAPVPPFHASSYHCARSMLDVAQLEAAVAANDRAARRHHVRRAKRSTRAALRVSAKVAWRRTEALRLAGRYRALVGDRRGALRWLAHSIAVGRRLGARPELARSYAEAARYLRDAARDRTLLNLTWQQYSTYAAEIFEQLNLEHDLARLREQSVAGRT